MGGRLLLSRGRELGRAPATGREPDGDRTRGRRLIIDFAAINRAALPVLLPLLRRWLSNGRREGREFVALNPRRADQHLGSFKINLVTGRWSDFASGDKGGDPISLAAYVFGLSQGEAARRLAKMLGVR